MIGTYVGNHRIVRELGKGGMGVVYEAINEQIERRAAVKILHARFSDNRAIAARFFNEARAANIICHPGIISISEFGYLDSGAAYIVMEYLEGETLRARLRKRLSEADLVRLGRQMASALTAAHSKNIVHRDLKPDNVMLVPDPDMPGGERVKILDFGIAKLAQEHLSPGLDSTEFHTGTGVALGTPIYMSPEQCRGAATLDGRSDVYSVGVIFYQMLAGQPPFVCEGAGGIIAMHIYETPRSLQEAAPGVLPALAQLVHAMLAKDPLARPFMAQVAEQLEAIGATGNTSPALLPAAPSAEAEAQKETPPRLSTLGQAAVQSQVPPRQSGSARWAAAASAVLVLSGAGLGVRTLLVPRPGASPKAQPGPAPAATPALPAPEVAAPATVRVVLSTEPGGAQVIRASDQQVLGTTPWHGEEPLGPGELGIILRHKGYADRSLRLDLSKNTSRHERLRPLRPASPGSEELTNDKLKLVD